jgi:hypothetical protein
VKDPDVLKYTDKMTSFPVDALVECDGCGSLAREDLIAVPMFGADHALLSSPAISDPLGSVLAGMPGLFKGMLPERDPETRTERMVRAFMTPWGIPEDRAIPHVARTMVKLARAVETELDMNPGHGSSEAPRFTSPEGLALVFHETYERLAPHFGYETRADTKVFDAASKNGRLMVAVCGELLDRMPADHPLPDLKPRDFNTDFLYPALDGIEPARVRQVSVALDCAIAFGALEAQTTNTSLKLSAQLESMYWDKVAQLHKLVY